MVMKQSNAHEEAAYAWMRTAATHERLTLSDVTCSTLATVKSSR